MVNTPAVMPIDEAVTQHRSQVYWKWRAAFDRDPQASPLQHPDFVLAELATRRDNSSLNAVLVHEDSSRDQSTIGILSPKTIRTSQVGGFGPGLTLRGLRLVGGRFLGECTSPEQQRRMLQCATRYAAEANADFLLIEDLNGQTSLYDAVQDQTTHRSHLFVTHGFQPHHSVEFPATEADYWNRFSSHSRKLFRRAQKKCAGARLERITEIDQIPDFLQAAHEISAKSWQSRQFGLRVRNDEAELRQLSALALHGLLRSYVFRIDDKPVAFAIGNQHAGCFRYEETGYNSDFSQLAPGRTMLLQIMTDLLRHNSPKYFDFGIGDAEYKQQFANCESRSGTVWLVPPTWRGTLLLVWLKVCRHLRSTAHAFIKRSGLGTVARQWIRSNGATPPATTNCQTSNAAQTSPATEKTGTTTAIHQNGSQIEKVLKELDELHNLPRNSRSNGISDTELAELVRLGETEEPISGLATVPMSSP